MYVQSLKALHKIHFLYKQKHTVKNIAYGMRALIQ